MKKLDYGKAQKKIYISKEDMFETSLDNLEDKHFFENDEELKLVHSNHETVISGNDWVFKHMAISTKGIFFDEEFDLSNKSTSLYGIHFNRKRSQKEL